MEVTESSTGKSPAGESNPAGEVVVDQPTKRKQKTDVPTESKADIVEERMVNIRNVFGQTVIVPLKGRHLPLRSNAIQKVKESDISEETRNLAGRNIIVISLA
jgi:hypothetical protein